MTCMAVVSVLVAPACAAAASWSGAVAGRGETEVVGACAILKVIWEMETAMPLEQTTFWLKGAGTVDFRAASN